MITSVFARVCVWWCWLGVSGRGLDYLMQAEQHEWEAQLATVRGELSTANEGARVAQVRVAALEGELAEAREARDEAQAALEAAQAAAEQQTQAAVAAAEGAGVWWGGGE